jgi:CheY-like chemotaxis protein
MSIANKRIPERKPMVIFADDDTLCLDVGVKMLQSLGYNVLKARNGQEAVDVYEKNQNEVIAAILDMNMPYNGGMTFERLKRINSKLKIIIASGYAEQSRINELFHQGCAGFIQKPFTLEILSKKLSMVLNN